MKPEYVLGPLLVVFIVAQIVRLVRKRGTDWSDDDTLGQSPDDDDDRNGDH